MLTGTTLTRRQFLRGAAVAAAAPYLISSSALGAGDRPAPGNRIAVGCIGVNNMGGGHLRALLGNKEVQVVGICDVDAKVREAGLKAAAQAYAKEASGTEGQGCKGYNDFRELIGRADLDAVVVATPDQWHAPISIAAMKAGKDVYCEKPMTLTIREGRAMVSVARRYGRVLQCGSQRRSWAQIRHACELVRNGRIGKLQTIRVAIPGNNRKSPVPWTEMPVPEGFDYDLWLGPAPWAPYHRDRCHYTFRFILDYSGGQVTNFGAHYLDVAQWGNGTDLTGPIEIEGQGEWPTDGLFNTATKVHFECLYANGVRLLCDTGRDSTRFEGTEGWINIDGKIEAQPKSVLTSRIAPSEIHLYESRGDHMGNFLQCVRTREPPAAPGEIGHRSATVCHLGNIAMRLGRKVKWDPDRERFVGDPEADRLLGRACREPWHL